MRIAIATDEISADLETALELALEWGVEGVEIRGYGEGRYPRVSPTLRDLAPRLVRASGLEVTAISPGLFKIPFPAAERPVSFYQWADGRRFADHSGALDLLADHVENLLPQSIEAALELGCPVIKCFGFTPADALLHEVLNLPHPMPPEIVDVMRGAATTVAAAGLTLCVENEMTCWTGTARATMELVEAVGQPNFKVAWDPANAFIAGDGESVVDTFATVASAVELVDFKDVRVDPATGRRSFQVEGDIDWVGQLAALRAIGFDGFVTVETHMRPKLASSRGLVNRLRQLLDS
ncbi:sugar phosphate isomerase/epimerase family protein [Jiangella muralis]|uniref:sugar phosphate isomerase/epimerase family protein n=1 Tax=Jiangella muralis TaxID=702383 RepID=UPI00069DD047|nr:sugar phosphate isomerase/epimerase family protein [Jiangella muralis]